MIDPEQRTLSATVTEAFYRQDFLQAPTNDFVELSRSVREGTVVDMGGGCGFFAQGLRDQAGLRVRVVDMDPRSVAACRQAGIEAECGHALHPRFVGDEAVVYFNLILHHLVAHDEPVTRALRLSALRVWHGKAKALFVNEYIYESFLATASGWLIYQITRNQLLSMIGKAISRVVPSFRANTFGVGVRFRAHNGWRNLFTEAGYDVAAIRAGRAEPVSPPSRSLLIRQIRRDSFWLTTSCGRKDAGSAGAPSGSTDSCSLRDDD